MPNGAHLSKTKIKKQAETEGWQSFGNHAPNFNKGPSILKSVQFVSFLFHVLLRLFNFSTGNTTSFSNTKEGHIYREYNKNSSTVRKNRWKRLDKFKLPRNLEVRKTA